MLADVDPALIITPADYTQYTPEPNSPWELLIFYLANIEKATEKIQRIHEYLGLKHMRDIHDKRYGQHAARRLKELKREIADAYFIKSDFKRLKDHADTKDDPEVKDFSERLVKLESYIDGIVRQAKSDSGKWESVKAAMERTAEANGRRREYVDILRQGVQEANRKNRPAVRDREPLSLGDIPTVSPGIKHGFLTLLLPEALQKIAGLSAEIENTAHQIATLGPESGQEVWVDEYIAGLKQIRSYLRHSNHREELTLVDLTFYIGEHRGASKYRGSTASYYASIDAFFADLILSFPSHETDRHSIERVHMLSDPEFQDLCGTLKLSLINAKHNFGLTREDIEVYGTVASMLGNIMRGFGIDEIDDRFKQYLHNTGDHSLRTLIPIAQVRDTLIRRMEQIYQDGLIHSEESERQIRLANETARHRAKWAILHDAGEFLGELLGNNMVNMNEEEIRQIKSLRDRIESYVESFPLIEELAIRLRTKGWSEDEITRAVAELEHVSSPAQSPEAIFDLEISKIYERLNTTHDIVAERSVGHLRWDRTVQNQKNINDAQLRYTMLYVFSKLFGHKAETTDPVDIAEYYSKEYKRELLREAHRRSDRIAQDVGAAVQYHGDLSRVTHIPDSSLILDDYLLQRDIDYQKSLFRRYVDQTIENHKKLDQAEARSLQIHAEAHLYAVYHEAVHYAKKCARVSGKLDARKVERAVRKSFSQGVAAMAQDLADRSDNHLSLQYLLPSNIYGVVRYRPLTLRLEGAMANPQKSHQISDFQNVNKAAAKIYEAANLLVRPWYRFFNTFSVGLMLGDLTKITHEEFQQLMQVTSHVEAGGDIGQTLIGVFGGLASGRGLAGLADFRNIAFINPFVTAALHKPMLQREAIEKCYGHVLAIHADAIAGKYNIAGAIHLIRKQSHMAKGVYQANPYDPLPSGSLAKNYFDYFHQQYSSFRNDILPATKFARAAERSERLHLHGIISEEIALIRDRICHGTCDPAEQTKLKENLAQLREARHTVDLWGRSPFFASFARPGTAIRFADITLIGLISSFSLASAEIVLPHHRPIMIPLLHQPLRTGMIYGMNLCLAGGAALLAITREFVKRDVGYTSKAAQFFKGLPYIEFDERGIYVVKGSNQKISCAAARDLIAGRPSDPSWGQIADLPVALIVTPIRSMANMQTAMDAFNRQHFATFLDNIGSITKACLSLNLYSVLQAITHTFVMCFFMRVALYNKLMVKAQEALADDKVPNLDNIKAIVAEELREGTVSWLLNCMRSAGKGLVALPIGRTMVKGINALSPNQLVARMALGAMRQSSSLNLRPT